LYCKNCGTATADDAVYCQKCGADLRAASAPTGSGMPGSTVPPSYLGANPMPINFNIGGVFKHAIDLVRSPAQVMSAYRDSDPSFNSIMINYVAVLAAIPLIATLIGGLWYYSIFGYLGFVGGTIYGYAFATAIIGYILDIVGVAIVSYIVVWLAPNFGAKTTLPRAARLTAYAFTPFFLASILNIIPFIGFLSVLGLLYGLYVLYLGVPIMLGTPQNESLTYTIVIVVAVIIVYAIIYAIGFGAVSLAFFHVF
jgi:hypothetical protein